jgi:hypothetical protein
MASSSRPIRDEVISKRHRLLGGRNVERELVLAGRDPLSRNRLQHLHLSGGVSRAEVLDLPRPASRLPDHLDATAPDEVRTVRT